MCPPQLALGIHTTGWLTTLPALSSALSPLHTLLPQDRPRHWVGRGASWLQLGLPSFLSAVTLCPGTAAPMGVLQTSPQIPPSQEASPYPPPHSPFPSSSHLLCTSSPSKTVRSRKGYVGGSMLDALRTRRRDSSCHSRAIRGTIRGTVQPVALKPMLCLPTGPFYLSIHTRSCPSPHRSVVLLDICFRFAGDSMKYWSGALQES